MSNEPGCMFDYNISEGDVFRQKELHLTCHVCSSQFTLTDTWVMFLGHKENNGEIRDNLFFMTPTECPVCHTRFTQCFLKCRTSSSESHSLADTLFGPILKGNNNDDIS